MNNQTAKDKLAKLHSLLIDSYIERVSEPDCKAADLNGARQLLKDNEVVISIEKDTNISALSTMLQEKRNKRVLKIVENDS